MPTAAQGMLGGLGQDALGGQGQDQQRQPQMGMYSRTTTTTQNPGQSIQSPAQPSVSTPQSPLTTGLTEMLQGGSGGLMRNPALEDWAKRQSGGTGAGGMSAGV